MKKVGAFSAAVVGSVVILKQYQNYVKELKHKQCELAKPYSPTLQDDLLKEIAKKAGGGQKTCVIIGGGVAGITSVRTEVCSSP